MTDEVYALFLKTDSKLRSCSQRKIPNTKIRIGFSCVSEHKERLEEFSNACDGEEDTVKIDEEIDGKIYFTVISSSEAFEDLIIRDYFK